MGSICFLEKQLTLWLNAFVIKPDQEQFCSFTLQ